MDQTISAYGVRDSAMEADIAASTIQRMLDRDPAMAPADCGLLIPDGMEYAIHVSDAFGRAGLPLSGLPAIGDRKDLAAELLTHFLLTRRPSGPAMALASLLSSPLMPWSMEIGQRLANAIMSGNFRPDVGLLDDAGKSLYRMIRQDTVPTPASLAEDLLVIQRTGSEETGFQQDQARLRDLIAKMRALLKAQRPDAEVQWDVLLRLAAPTAATSSAASLRTTLGVSVFSASRTPWRDVRHLFVLGYADGNYPGTAGTNPFFLDSELELIRDRCSLALPTQSQALADRMDTFQAQIGVASDSLTLLSPYRDCASGARLSPAASLPLLGRCIDVAEVEDIIIDLNGVAEDQWPMRIPRALETKSMPASVTLLVPEKIRLHRDLFAIRSKDDGSARRQSPSRLETLIVSPLAWLLSELDATDGVWEPEKVDVKLKGSLAHEVLEHLFLPQRPIPSAADIHEQVPALLTDRMRHIAPFMLTSRWGLERRTLERDILKAATNWREALIAQGAQVINNEFWLRGRVFGVEIHGKVDCLLRLPDGELIIVDHKKSGTRNRQERLEAGWDLQVELYRQMARTPAENGLADETQRMLSASNSIGVAYHLMNDGGILLSSEAKGPNAPSVKRMANDISFEAMAKLAREVEALRRGDVAMNTDEDRHFFSKTARMGLYAFDASPLISAFSVRTAQEDEEIDDE